MATALGVFDDLVEGWTGDLDFFLRADGDVPENSMAGMSVELVMKDASGNQINTTGNCSIVDADTWKVRYAPDSGDLVEGSYNARFKVTDGDGKVVYFPSRAWMQWRVRRPA